MEEKNTKEKIIYEALNLFSEKGYEAVSVKDIAAAVGIKAPSLYQHFENKQSIFDAILAKIKNEYGVFAGKSSISENKTPDTDIVAFQSMSEEQFIQTVLEFFDYFLHDDYTRKIRKMLTIEQYSQQGLAELWVNQYIDDPLQYHTNLFQPVLEFAGLEEYDAKIVGIQFYAPMFLLLRLCDAQPHKEIESRKILAGHIKQFNRIYNFFDRNPVD